MMRDGALVVNPQIEWGGGGFVSTAADLARWMAAFRQGNAFPRELWPEVSRGVDASSLAPGVQWGLGIAIRTRPLGVTYGHGGIFPGYLTQVWWYEALSIALAVQVNTSEIAALPNWAKGTLLNRAAAALEDTAP
jgi:D-alanyl-D-alanine carboxypeptidase